MSDEISHTEACLVSPSFGFLNTQLYLMLHVRVGSVDGSFAVRSSTKGFHLLLNVCFEK